MSFDDALEEAVSNATVMDVSELRMLYYGRIGVYASFSNDGEHVSTGIKKGQLEHPMGVIAYSIPAIVGKKVSSPDFYANVFRLRPNGVLDSSSYSRDDLNTDIETLRILPGMKDQYVTDAVEIATANLRLRSNFERLWVITREISENYPQADKKWRDILIDLGYDAITDKRGRKLITKSTEPVTLVLNMNSMTDLDIVPIQKYRKDRRQSVVRKINLKNKRLWQARNRVAKRRTDKYRGNSRGGGVSASVAAFRELVLGL